MHPTAAAGFVAMLNLAQDHGMSIHHSGLTRVLDIGGADVNGTIHAAIRAQMRPVIDVLDIEPGPGVTIVGDARDRRIYPSGVEYDLVVTTECFEHVDRWSEIVENAWWALTRGGWFIGTAASVGRRPHGARGDHDPAEGEHYANVEPGDLIKALRRLFGGGTSMWVTYAADNGFATTHDVYWAVRKA
jgi:hypothetical protein